MISLGRSALLTGVSSLAICAMAAAVTTSDWTHTTEADFSGKMESVVASSLGELRLSRATQRLLEQDPRFDVVYGTKRLPDGSIVFGTGPAGAVMKLADGKLSELYKPADAALASAVAIAPDGKLLVGLSGNSARLVRIDPTNGRSTEMLQTADAQFVWAIHALPDGSAIVGTGPTGQLLHVAPDGKSRVILTARQNNILSILPLANDMVVIGTDPDGLVIRVNTTTGEWFVLYDAPEPEIAALVSAPDGTIYAAATSAVTVPGTGDDTADAAPGRLEATPDVPFRREPPSPPLPPKLPDPSPNEPEPIPKSTPVRNLSISDDGNSDPLATAVPSSQPSTVPTPAHPAGGSDEIGTGSAIYRISAGGFVNEVFRRSASIHSMLLAGDSLLVGTGPEGKVFEVRPATEELLMVAQSSSRQVSAMDIAKDGRILMGVSNPGGLLRMDSGHASKGTYTSEPLDAEQVAQFGMLQLQGTLPAGTSVSVAMRSGNVQDPESGGWSKWSEDLPAAEFLQIAAPPARFMQYRVTMSTKEPAATPVIEEVKVNYLLPNMPPKIASVSLEPEATDEMSSAASYKITWEGSDPNDDELVYALHYRLGHKGKWILLKEDVKESSFSWNTRQMADGRYQVRVTASDAKANTTGDGLTGTRFTDPLIIDNTPPVIGDVKTQVKGGQVSVSLRTIDRTSTVSQVQFAVDSSDDWQAAASSDMLYDSPDETVKFTTAKLAEGPHQVTIRARDSSGNAAYETLLVAVEKEKQ